MYVFVMWDLLFLIYFIIFVLLCFLQIENLNKNYDRSANKLNIETNLNSAFKLKAKRIFILTLNFFFGWNHSKKYWFNFNFYIQNVKQACFVFLKIKF